MNLQNKITQETLKKLHETFSDFDTDTLLKILDCYVESPTKLSNTIPWHGPGTSPKPWENITYCQD